MFNHKLSAHLALLAGVSGLIYGLIFSLPFPLARFYATIPPIDYTKLTNYSVGGLAAYVIGLGSLFLLYRRAIHASLPGKTGGQPISLPFIIILSSGLLALISVFAYPLTAIDLFIYAIRTRGWALYSLNPLATAPAQLPATDPWLKLAAEWVDAPSPYGPLWEWLSLGAFYASGGGFLQHLFALKILAMLAYLGCVWFVYQILQRLRPEWALAGTIAFAWNPLALLESVQNGHNDIVMTFFLLAAVWMLFSPFPVTPSRLFVCLFLALSILVKFVTVMVVPFFLLGMASHQTTWLRRLAWLAGYGLIIAMLVGLPMIPFWPGWENWAVLQAGSQAGRSLMALLILGLKEMTGLNLAFDIARNLILALFSLIYLYLLWQLFTRLRRASFSPEAGPAPIALLTIRPAFFSLFWYVLLVAPVFHAWYLLWFLPLAALLLPQRRLLTAAIVFSVTGLLIIPYFETIRVWYPFLLQNQFIGHLIGVPLLIVPPALALRMPISPSQNSEV